MSLEKHFKSLSLTSSWKNKNKKAIKDSRTLHYRRLSNSTLGKNCVSNPTICLTIRRGSVWSLDRCPFYFGKAPWSHVWHGHHFNVDQILSSHLGDQDYIGEVKSPNHVAKFWPNFKKLVLIWSPRNI